MRHVESDTQIKCVRWFRYVHPELSRLLFAVGNGGRRDRITGAIMKAEGVLAGVSDLLFLKANAHHHGLCIEMKTPTGRQSESQKEWEKAVTDSGYLYALCRSFEDFTSTMEDYLKDNI